MAGRECQVIAYIRRQGVVEPVEARDLSDPRSRLKSAFDLAERAIITAGIHEAEPLGESDLSDYIYKCQYNEPGAS